VNGDAEWVKVACRSKLFALSVASDPRDDFGVEGVRLIASVPSVTSVPPWMRLAFHRLHSIFIDLLPFNSCPLRAPGRNARLSFSSFDWRMRAFAVLGLVFSVPSHAIDWRKRLRDDLLRVDWDVKVKPNLNQSINQPFNSWIMHAVLHFCDDERLTLVGIDYRLGPSAPVAKPSGLKHQPFIYKLQ